MTQRLGVLAYAVLLGWALRLSLIAMSAAIVGGFPDALLAHPWLDFALKAPFVALIEAASHALIGFAYWSGTDDRVPSAFAWSLAAAAALGATVWPVPPPSLPLLLSLTACARLFGLALGPWLGARTEHDPRAVEIRRILFLAYPFRLR